MNDIFKQNVNKPTQLDEEKISMTRILATFLLNKRRFLTKIGDPFLETINSQNQQDLIWNKMYQNNTEIIISEYFLAIQGKKVNNSSKISLGILMYLTINDIHSAFKNTRSMQIDSIQHTLYLDIFVLNNVD